MLVVDAVTSATARRFPVRRIGRLAKERGIPFFVDGAHSPGSESDPLGGLEADFWVGNLQKFACPPR